MRRLLRKLFGERQKHASECGTVDIMSFRVERSLNAIVSLIPFANHSQKVALTKVIAGGEALDKTPAHLVLDAPSSGLPATFLMSPIALRRLSQDYEAAYRCNPFIRFTMQAEKVWAANVLRSFKNYCTRADDAGASFIILTGGDIERMFHAVDVAKDFLAFKRDEGHKEACDLALYMHELFYDDETVVLLQMDALPSDTLLDTMIAELTRHVYIMGLGELVRRYGTMEFVDAEHAFAEGNSIAQCCQSGAIGD